MDVISYMSSLRSLINGNSVITPNEARSYINTLIGTFDVISADYFPPFKCIKHANYQKDEQLESYYVEYFTSMMGLTDNSYLGNFGDMFYNLPEFAKNKDKFFISFNLKDPDSPYYREIVKYFIKNLEIDNLAYLVKRIKPTKSFLPEITKYYFKLPDEELDSIHELIPTLPEPKTIDLLRSDYSDLAQTLKSAFSVISMSSEYKEIEDINSKLSKLKPKDVQILSKRKEDLLTELENQYSEFYATVSELAIADSELAMFFYFLDLESFFRILDFYPIRSKREYFFTIQDKINLIRRFDRNDIYRLLSYGNNNLMNYFFRVGLITLDEFTEKNKPLLDALKYVRFLNIIDDLLTNLKVPKKTLSKLIIMSENVYPLILRYVD